MNRDFDVDQSLERLSAFDRQYVGQLNDVAAIDARRDWRGLRGWAHAPILGCADASVRSELA